MHSLTLFVLIVKRKLPCVHTAFQVGFCACDCEGVDGVRRQLGREAKGEFEKPPTQTSIIVT